MEENEMKMKKVLAAMAAMAVAATMAISASAAYDVPAENIKDGATAFLIGDESKGENGPFNDKADELATYVAVTFTIELNEAEAADCAGGGETWVGGGVGFNSDSTGWEQHEWTPKALDENGEPVKELTLTKVSDGVYEVTFKREDGSSIFKADDTYAQIWMQDWSTKNAKLAGVKLLTADDLAGGSDTPDDPEPDKPSDDTPDTGVTAGLAFAGLALAGAAVVATKKK